MILVLQILVIFIASALAIKTIGGSRSHRTRAWKKLLLLLLAIFMVIAVLWPDITNKLAKLVGVGRGADLLLYLLSISFIIYVLNSYLRQQEQVDQTFRLARKIAIIEANERYNKK